MHVTRAVGLLTTCIFKELLVYSYHAWPSHIMFIPKAVYVFIPWGERGGSVVECRTPEQEVRGSRPTAAVLCPWASHCTPRKYWLITQEAMAPSRHDWKIVDWDVKPQHNQIIPWRFQELLAFLYPACSKSCWPSLIMEVPRAVGRFTTWSSESKSCWPSHIVHVPCWPSRIMCVPRPVGFLTSCLFQELFVFSYHGGSKSFWLSHLIQVSRAVGLLTACRFQDTLTFSYQVGSKSCWPSPIMFMPRAVGLLTSYIRQDLLVYSHHASPKSCWSTHIMQVPRAVGLLTSCRSQELLV